MKRKFLSNLLLLLIMNILIKPFWFFGIEVGVQNAVGEAMYGFYFSLFNFAFVANILLDFGITNYNNRTIARNHESLPEYLSVIIPLKFTLSLVYAVVVFVAAFFVGYSRLQVNLLIILVINQFLSSFILYLRSNISGIQLFRTDSMLSVLDRTLMIIMNSILLWSSLIKQPYKIEWFVYSQTVSYGITAMVVLFIVLHHAGKPRIQFNPKQFLEILRKSYPFAILILLMSVFNRVDSIMIERMLVEGKKQAGIYAQSFRVLDALSQFALLFAGLLLPMFSKMIKKKEKTDGLLSLSSSLLLSVTCGTAVAGLFFNEEIIELMYGPSHSDSPAIFSILMWSVVFISLSYIYGTMLTANRSLKYLNILAGITVVINITLNLLLIPRMLALGAAISSLISQSFYAVAQYIGAHWILKIKIPYRMIIKLLIYISIMTLSGWLLKNMFTWQTAFLLFVFTCMLVSIVIGLLRPFELMLIFREDKDSQK